MRTLAILAVLLSIPTGALADAERRCTRAKVRAAMDYARVYYECYADGAAIGGEPNFACLQAASNAVKAAVAAAGAGGPCPGTPDGVANSICVPFLSPGDSACRAAVYRATGWNFVRRLACHGNALRHGEAPRTGCFIRTESRFAQRIARALALGPCSASADNLETLVDRCVTTMSTTLSCGNERLDYGELCEGESDFCSAPACYVAAGACCLTSSGCFQFGGPIEVCYFNGGYDIQPGFCTLAGTCAEDIPISSTPVCCQHTGGGCTDGVATTATELYGLAGTCTPGNIAIVGTCGTDGRCAPSSPPPVAQTTTSTEPPPTSTSTTVVTARREPAFGERPQGFPVARCGACAPESPFAAAVAGRRFQRLRAARRPASAGRRRSTNPSAGFRPAREVQQDIPANRWAA
jgi:hypothetical protein